MSQLNWHQFEETLEEKGLKIFSPREVALFMDTSLRAARGFLSYNVEKGTAVKLRRGYYAIRRNLPSDFLIANKIYKPSYISLYSALSHYHFIPETVYSITSITSKPKREFSVIGKHFSYRKIKQAAFAGYRPQEYMGDVILIATPEKAVIDYLYFVALGQRSLNERLDLTRTPIERDEIDRWLKVFDHEPLNRLWKEVAQKHA